MFTILGADGKEYGPVPADKVQAWIATRRANLQTKARREGETEWKTLAVFGILLGIIPVLYLCIAWAFTFILIIDRRLGPWTAMEVSRRVVTKQWFRVFFVALLGGILAMLGLFGLLIGVLFTLPLAFGAIVHAYEGLCNPPVADAVT